MSTRFYYQFWLLYLERKFLVPSSSFFNVFVFVFCKMCLSFFLLLLFISLVLCNLGLFIQSPNSWFFIFYIFWFLNLIYFHFLVSCWLISKFSWSFIKGCWYTNSRSRCIVILFPISSFRAVHGVCLLWKFMTCLMERSWKIIFSNNSFTRQYNCPITISDQNYISVLVSVIFGFHKRCMRKVCYILE